jgi:hypothetical protein
MRPRRRRARRVAGAASSIAVSPRSGKRRATGEWPRRSRRPGGCPVRCHHRDPRSRGPVGQDSAYPTPPADRIGRGRGSGGASWGSCAFPPEEVGGDQEGAGPGAVGVSGGPEAPRARCPSGSGFRKTFRRRDESAPLALLAPRARSAGRSARGRGRSAGDRLPAASWITPSRQAASREELARVESFTSSPTTIAMIVLARWGVCPTSGSRGSDGARDEDAPNPASRAPGSNAGAGRSGDEGDAVGFVVLKFAPAVCGRGLGLEVPWRRRRCPVAASSGCRRNGVRGSRLANPGTGVHEREAEERIAAAGAGDIAQRHLRHVLRHVKRPPLFGGELEGETSGTSAAMLAVPEPVGTPRPVVLAQPRQIWFHTNWASVTVGGPRVRRPGREG